MRPSTLTVAAIAAIALGGCATIMAGGPDHVAVESNPPGASVYLDDQLVGQTPMNLTLDRDRSCGLIRVEADGYEPVAVQRSKHINGWFWANLCLGGVIGIVVDLVTGDVKRFDDTPVRVNLAPSGPRGEPAYSDEE
jgi:hypothetical protein